MQNLIFWFFSKYGFYFYIEKFKVINDKILLQFYYYKTYLYYRKSYKKIVRNFTGRVNLAAKSAVAKTFTQFKLNSSFYILARKRTWKQHRPRFAKGRQGLLEKNVFRLYSKYINFLYLANFWGKLTPKNNIFYKFYCVFYKLFIYFKKRSAVFRNFMFFNMNNKKFLFMENTPNNNLSALDNHLFKYFHYAIGKPKIPKNKYVRLYLLRDIEALRRKKKQMFLARIERLQQSPVTVSAELSAPGINKGAGPLISKNKSSWGPQGLKKPFIKKRYKKDYKKQPQMPYNSLKNQQLQCMKRSLAFNFFFTYYFAFFFHCQTSILYKSIYKYMFAHSILRQEYSVLTQRSKYLRKRNAWAFDFLFFLHYSVTFANTIFLWPFLVYHLKRTFKRHGATMQLIINVLRTIFFLKPYFKGFKLMIKGPFDRHGRSRKLLLHLGHMGFTEYMQHPVIYDMIHCPIVYGMCSIKFWMVYE